MAGIYIHYPFCKSKCYYCDFYSVTNLDLRDSFLKALMHEISLRKDFFGDMKLDTIYFGGGTPSLLAPHKMQEIINTLISIFEFNEKPEITIEINPDDVGSSFVKELKNINKQAKHWHTSILQLLLTVDEPKTQGSGSFKSC